MKLTLEKVKIKDLQLGDRTNLTDGILYVNRRIFYPLQKPNQSSIRLKLILQGPGQHQLCRVVDVISQVQVRAPRTARVLTVAGNRRKGRSRVVEGMGIVICQNNTYRSASGVPRHERPFGK